MKPNMLKLSSRDYIRRMTSAMLAPYSASALPKELAAMLPTYKVTLPVGTPGKTVRLLAVLTTRTHGKKRIYSEVGGGQNPLHIYYVSKNDVFRLAKKSNSNGAGPTLVDAGLTDRWCVAFGRPICVCKNLREWLNGIVCIESTSTKRNHPPVGSTTKDSAWKFGPFFEQSAAANLMHQHPADMPKEQTEFSCKIALVRDE